jgi:hypothetical protein
VAARVAACHFAEASLTFAIPTAHVSSRLAWQKRSQSGVCSKLE